MESIPSFTRPDVTASPRGADKKHPGEPVPSSSRYAGPAEEMAAPSAAAHITSLAAEIRELRAQLEQIRAERNRLAETQRRIMELLSVQSSDKLVHDVRNVLNERELLKALVGDM